MELETQAVEVFKTMVTYKKDADTVLKLLLNKYPNLKINFDLDDCDKILRVEGDGIEPEKIIELLTINGYPCEILQ
jgi:hypothetical protein